MVIICDSFDFSKSFTVEKRSFAFDGWRNASSANNSYGRRDIRYQHEVYFGLVFLLVGIYAYSVVSSASTLKFSIIEYTVYRLEVLFLIQ